MEKKQKVPKTVGKRYVVQVNNNPVFTGETLKEARAYVTSLVINDSIEGVSIVKETVTETLLSTFTPQVQKVLVASDLDFDTEELEQA